MKIRETSIVTSVSGVLELRKLSKLINSMYIIEFDGKEFYNSFELKRHKATFHGIRPEGVHQCKFCPLFFRAVASLEKHMVSKHS